MKSFNQYWRLYGTASSFAIFGLGTLCISIVLSFLLPLLPAKKIFKKKLTRKIIHRTAQIYVGYMALIRLAKIELPQCSGMCSPGTLVIANHPTLLDAVFMMSLMPDATFIVKSALARNPFTFALIHYAGYITNHCSGPELVDRATACLKAGDTLAIFPEGTRSTGDGVLKFQRGAANIALQAQCNIQPLHIDCSPILLRKSDKWHYVPVQVPTYSIQILELIHIEDVLSKTNSSSLQARHLNRRMEDVLRTAMQV